MPEVVVLGDSAGARSRAPGPMPGLEAIKPTPHASKMLLVATQEICDLFARLASKVSQLFRDWDLDGNGLIDKKEFRAACVSLGVSFPRDIVDGVFDILDDDGSGTIDHGELVRKARKAAFERGFIPRKEGPAPNAFRKLDAYWARRNRMHMEDYAQQVQRPR